MKHGMPFHLAFGVTRAEADHLVLDSVERTAIAIVMSEIEGSKFDWNAMTFIKDP